MLQYDIYSAYAHPSNLILVCIARDEAEIPPCKPYRQLSLPIITTLNPISSFPRHRDLTV